jgi:hypothetical protein
VKILKCLIITSIILGLCIFGFVQCDECVKRNDLVTKQYIVGYEHSLLKLKVTESIYPYSSEDSDATAMLLPIPFYNSSSHKESGMRYECNVMFALGINVIDRGKTVQKVCVLRVPVSKTNIVYSNSQVKADLHIHNNFTFQGVDYTEPLVYTQISNITQYLTIFCDDFTLYMPKGSDTDYIKYLFN